MSRCHVLSNVQLDTALLSIFKPGIAIMLFAYNWSNADLWKHTAACDNMIHSRKQQE